MARVVGPPSLGLATALVLALPACPPRSNPSWGADASAASGSASTPTPPTSLRAPPSAAPEPQDTASLEVNATDAGRTGDSWESCYAGYRQEGAPVKDVMRLGLLCGPRHGMHEVRPGAGGKLEAGATHRHAFRAERGQCFRVVGVDAGGVMSLEIADSSGQALARSNAASWSVVPARGLWCAERGGDYEVRVQGVSGSGEFAMQLWLLP